MTALQTFGVMHEDKLEAKSRYGYAAGELVHEVDRIVWRMLGPFFSNNAKGTPNVGYLHFRRIFQGVVIFVRHRA